MNELPLFHGYKGKNVYVFELSNGEIKIGATKDIKKRMKQIERQNRCKILNYDCTCILANWREVEKRLHEHFKEHLVKGQFEYFNINFFEAWDKLLEFQDEYGRLEERNPEQEKRNIEFIANYFGWI